MSLCSGEMKIHIESLQFRVALEILIDVLFFHSI